MEYDVANIIVPDGIVAIARSNREDNLTIRSSLQRALPPSGEAGRSLTFPLTFESPSSPNSMFFKLLLSLSFIDVGIDKSRFLEMSLSFFLKFLLLYFILLNLVVY